MNINLRTAAPWALLGGLEMQKALLCGEANKTSHQPPRLLLASRQENLP